ncbi:hypothetical protein [Nonomuraea sp. NPDC050643]|uniref:hypothetical protein n=1 Tax=Nonomuraea sp. NPDC050643 TaxID=3155660 RepID=UPI0033F3E0CE
MAALPYWVDTKRANAGIVKIRGDMLSIASATFQRYRRPWGAHRDGQVCQASGTGVDAIAPRTEVVTLRTCAVDVFATEPPDLANPLLGTPGIIRLHTRQGPAVRNRRGSTAR